MVNRRSILVAIAIAAWIACLSGCEKKEQPSKPSQPAPSKAPAPAAKPEVNQPAGPNTPVGATTEQTICPVLAGPIDKNVFIEYNGKKVYFCCEACKEAFNKDPAKYIAALPQFKQ